MEKTKIDYLEIEIKNQSNGWITIHVIDTMPLIIKKGQKKFWLAWNGSRFADSKDYIQFSVLNFVMVEKVKHFLRGLTQ